MSTTPLIIRLTKNLHWAEALFLAGLVIGMILTSMHIDPGVTKVSLFGLAATFFLAAYKPMDIQKDETKPAGFPELLANMIVPKVMWIGSSVSVMGIAFYLLHMKGYEQMLMIGGSTLAMTVLLFAFLLAGGVKDAKFAAPILLRAVPLLFIDFYILFSQANP